MLRRLLFHDRLIKGVMKIDCAVADQQLLILFSIELLKSL